MAEFCDFELDYLIHARQMPGERRENSARHTLVLVHEGTFVYRVEDKRFTIRADEAFYCPAQMAYEREKSTGEVSYTAISFSCQPDGEPLPLSHHVHSTASRELKYYLRHLLTIWAERKMYFRQRCHALLSLIVYELIRLNPPADENPYVAAIKAYIMEDMSRRIPVEEIAGRVHLYPTYCSELFRRSTGITISEYALRARIEYAAHLLANTQASVAEIAEACGFCDRYYFTRVFKAQRGVTPSQYRKSMH